MRKLLAAVFALCALPVFAQMPAQPAASTAGSSWQNVLALPSGTGVYIKAFKGGKKCKLRSADADSVTCNDAKKTVFMRVEIKSIKRIRRGRSVLVGLGIGAGAGAIAGAAGSGCSATQQQSFFGCFLTPTKPEGAAIGGVLLGGIGALLGLTDFTRSIVYRAP